MIIIITIGIQLVRGTLLLFTIKIAHSNLMYNIADIGCSMCIFFGL